MKWVSSASREEYDNLIASRKELNDFYCANCDEHSVSLNNHTYADWTRCAIFELMSSINEKIKNSPEYEEERIIEK